MNLPIPFDQFLALFGSGLVVALVLAALGKGINAIVFSEGIPVTHAGLTGWRRSYRRSLPIHGVLAGALVGALCGWLPVPEFLGVGIGASSTWYAAWGAIANFIHDRIVDFVDGDDDDKGKPSVF